MSPEYNFHIKADLPDRRVARRFAESLAENADVIEVIVFSAGQVIEGVDPGHEVTQLTKAQALKDERLKLGLSQEELAGIIGLSHAMVSFLESGRSPGSKKTISALLQAFSIPEDDPKYRLFMQGVSRPR